MCVYEERYASSLVISQLGLSAVQVETIGDAYMVSSGIPIPNHEHASELADMALTLCHYVTKFKVKNSLFFYPAIANRLSTIF